MAISLFVVGDFVPKGIRPEVLQSKSERIFHPIMPYINEADFSIANLEAPVATNKLTPIKKSGPCLNTWPSSIEVLKKIGFNVLTLANNHFYDQGQSGVNNTIDICNKLNILTVGGGKNVTEARKPLFLGHNNERVAIINACEHEFSIAENDHGGSNALDLINIQEDIARVRKDNDYIVLILHGGIEQYQYPTPRMKRWYRHFIDLGADVIVNHHQHCMNGFEVYKGKLIFYGLGNFFFPQLTGVKKSETWGYGYAVKLIFNSGVGYQLIPYHQDYDGITIRDVQTFNNEIELLNLPIKDDYLLQQKFDEYIIDIERKLKTQLLPSFLQGRLISKMARLGFLGNLYKGAQIYALKNKFTCESHYETIRSLFNILVK